MIMGRVNISVRVITILMVPSRPIRHPHYRTVGPLPKLTSSRALAKITARCALF